MDLALPCLLLASCLMGAEALDADAGSGAGSADSERLDAAAARKLDDAIAAGDPRTLAWAVTWKAP